MSGLAQSLITNALMATMLAGVLALVGRHVRRPALLHFLWLVVLLRLLAPPGWTVAELPGVRWSASDAEAPGGPGAGPSGTARRGGDLATGDGQTMGANAPSVRGSALAGVWPPTGDEFEAWPRSGSTGPRGDLAGTAGRSDAAPESSDDRAALGPRAEPGLMPVLAAALMIWFVGSVWTLGHLLVRSRRFARAVRNASTADEAAQSVATALAGKLGLRRAPPLYLVDAHLPPLVWGGWRGARVLFPKSMFLSLPSDQRDALLAHELAHVARRDPWVRWIESAATVVFWWLPTVWWARARLRLAEEMACDAWVTWCLPGHGRAYAEALVHTLDSLSEPRWSAPPLTSGVRPLESLRRRLTMILSTPSSRSPRLPWRGGAFVATLLVLGTSVGVAGGVQDEDPGMVRRLQNHRGDQAAKIRDALGDLEVMRLEWSATGPEVRVILPYDAESGVGERSALARRLNREEFQSLGWTPVKLEHSDRELHLTLQRTAGGPQDPQEFRPGDVVRIRDRQYPDSIDGNYKVRPDGTIDEPMIGTLAVAGKSVSEVAREIQARFKELRADAYPSVERLPAARLEDVSVIRLRHALAQEMAETLRTLVAASRDSRPVPEFELLVDSRTNSLLVTGDAEVRNEVNALARRLDIEIVGAEAPRDPREGLSSSLSSTPGPASAPSGAVSSPAPAVTIGGRIEQLEVEEALLRARLRALEVELETLRAVRDKGAKKRSSFER